MQEDVTHKTIDLTIKTSKLTLNIFKKALSSFVSDFRKNLNSIGKNPPKGRQSIKSLVRQGAALTNIEITDGNIKAFERYANKYGIDFALKKDKTQEPPVYHVFFKGKDIDVINAAFKDFLAEQMKRSKKPPIRERLKTLAQTLAQTVERVRERTKNHEQSR